jgi:ribosomal protein L11 methyltransferase
MPWIQLKLNTTGAHAEDLSDALMEAGAVSITFQDTHDTPVFEPLPGETRLWGDTDVIGLFDAESDMHDVVAILEQHPLLGAGFTHKIEQLEDKDWEREWMDNFHPMRFGERLWICPSWREVPDANAVNVMLDPGLAFGTGTHPTTSLCLQWLDGLDLTGKTIIDFGCGSGILAIAALKLGAAKASVLISTRRQFRPAVITPSVTVSPIVWSSIYRRTSQKRSAPMWWSPTSWQGHYVSWPR